MMIIGSYSFEEYLAHIKSFHGNTAPGMVIGGVMVDMALRNLPEGTMFDALCETSSCLPDAIQLLTPCTIGNGWLKIINLGRFALTLFEKYEGQGIRVFLDVDKVKAWPEIKSWYFRLKPKKEQDLGLILDQIKEAGTRICTVQRVTVRQQFLAKPKKTEPVAICSSCGESFPGNQRGICRACRGESPYLSPALTASGKRCAVVSG